MIGVLLGVLLALPLAAAVGAGSQAGQLAQSVEERATHHPATATLLADAPTSVVSTDLEAVDTGATDVPARWTVNGAERTGPIPAHPGDRAGAQVPIWVNQSGDPVAAPVTPSDAALTGVLVGISVWLLAVMTLAAMFRIGRWLLDRRRAAQWDREWLLVSGHWTRS